MDTHVRSTFDQYRAQMEAAATRAGAIGNALEKATCPKHKLQQIPEK